jgi:CRP-like cAMP-binding protein
MIALGQSQTGNRLLDQLPPRERKSLSARMENQTLPLRETLLLPRAPLQYAYFPITNVLSKMVVLRDGSAVEAAAIGNEGVAGVGLLIGERVSSYSLVQQVEGECLRVAADQFQSMLRESPQLRNLVERYTLILLRQCAQNAACNVRHDGEKRLSRWLLACADRAGRDEFDFTQDYLGVILGISRQSVSTVIQSLQMQDLISYRRRHLRILDRPGLQQTACECYEVAVSAYNELMEPAA